MKRIWSKAKTVIFLSLFVFISGTVGAADVRVEAKAKYFSPSGQAFKDIYGSGIVYGGEISIGLWNKLKLWITGSYFSKKGELSFTKEETTLRIIPIGIGIKYIQSALARVEIYGGIGINSNTYKEENPIGKVSTNKIGFIGSAGTYIKVSDGLFFDLYLDYSYCKIKPEELSENIGGYGAGVGIGYRF